MQMMDTFVTMQKANVELMNKLARTSIQGYDKLAKLQVKAATELTEDAYKHANAVLAAEGIREALSMQAQAAKPLVEKVVRYGREAYEVVSGANAEMGEVVQARWTEDREQFTAWMEKMASEAPVGSEAATKVMKNAVAAANNAYDSIQKVVKQAADMAEANMNAMVEKKDEPAKAKAKKATTSTEK